MRGKNSLIITSFGKNRCSMSIDNTSSFEVTMIENELHLTKKKK